MAVQYRIEGTTLPVVIVTLTPENRIFSSSGGMSWMTQAVEMDTNTGGGLGKMFKRALSGESLFIVDYYVDQGQGEVAFAAEFPGKVVDLHLAAGEQMIVQKDAFMCAEKSVDLDMHFRKRLGAGLFGGFQACVHQHHPSALAGEEQGRGPPVADGRAGGLPRARDDRHLVPQPVSHLSSWFEPPPPKPG